MEAFELTRCNLCKLQQHETHSDLSFGGRSKSYLKIPGSVEDETFIFLSSLKAIDSFI